MPELSNNLKLLSPNLNNDLSALHQIWTAAFPAYPLTQTHLAKLITHPNGHHLIAKIDEEKKPVAFALAYTARTKQQDPTSETVPTSGFLAVLAVHPDYQRRGIGTALVNETKAWFKSRSEPSRYKLEVGSGFPRFWPGIPVPVSGVSLAGDQNDGDGDGDGDRKTLGSLSAPYKTALEFFINRGFKIRPDPPRSVDLYRDIRSFSLDEKGFVYGQRAEEAGYTFSPLTADGWDECLAGQERNFGYNLDWVAAYKALPPAHHPNHIMTAFSPTGHQMGWTLMLPPSSDMPQGNWAMPAVCGPKTGLIGCVGIDAEHRGSGVGAALVAHAMRYMREAGVEGVFVDWVALEGFYERLGFEVWGRYRVGEFSG